MPLSGYAANLLATAEAHGTAYQGPDVLYLALMSTESVPSTDGTEIAGDGYARLAFTPETGYTNDGLGGLVNAEQLDWPEAVSDWGSIVEVAAYDDPTAGNRWWSEVQTLPIIVATGQTYSIAAGALARQAV
jgi:hypothetical protein